MLRRGPTDEVLARRLTVKDGVEVAPPITGLVFDVYQVAHVELQRCKSRQASGMPVDTKALKALVDTISLAHRMEREEERRSRLEQLSDEELGELVAQAKEMLG
jgi:hypothetical protein